MEQTLHELNVDGLNMKLTNEKLFINSAGSSETFALRSICGIGVLDLVEKYNQELSEFKEKTKKLRIGLGISTLIGFVLIKLYFFNHDSEIFMFIAAF